MNFGYGSGVDWGYNFRVTAPPAWSSTPFDPPAGPQLPHQGLILPRVTRLELIHNGGREIVRYGVGDVQVHLQDDERTLKVFYIKED